jgi:hypothetical protein
MEIAKAEKVLEGRIIGKDELKRCGTCHEVKDDVLLVTDPFSREVYGEDVEVRLCDRCYAAAADDV